LFVYSKYRLDLDYTQQLAQTHERTDRQTTEYYYAACSSTML